jgi:hypothetical protein
MKVFVLLPTHLDAVLWRRRYELGEVPDIVPYGYHHAADAGCEVRFSRPTPIDKGPFGLLRRVLNRLLGCDLIHAFNNRAEFVRSQCDVVWTHTEYEHLAVRLIELLSLGRIKAAPMISQSVWLMDRWSTYSALRRLAYRRLLRKSEVLTFLSPCNAEATRKCHFGLPVEIVPFGISQDSFPVGCPRDTPTNMPLRVFSLGNDVHRDWETFAAAFGDQSDFEVRVASRTYPKHLERANIVARSLNQSIGNHQELRLGRHRCGAAYQELARLGSLRSTRNRYFGDPGRDQRRGWAAVLFWRRSSQLRSGQRSGKAADNG